MDPADEPDALYDEVPVEELSPLEQFDRMAAHRVEGMKIRARVRDYAARLLAEHGVDGANDRLPPDISIDSDGVVRFDNAYQRDVRVAGDRRGRPRRDRRRHPGRLPPTRRICAATGVVTIDPDLEPWW